jgi:hypothetical protein
MQKESVCYLFEMQGARRVSLDHAFRQRNADTGKRGATPEMGMIPDLDLVIR